MNSYLFSVVLLVIFSAYGAEEVDTGDLNIESGNSSYILPDNPKLRNARNSWQQRAKDLFSAGGSAASIRDALKNAAGVGDLFVWVGTSSSWDYYPSKVSNYWTSRRSW